jgi:hypothetical protein
MRRNVRTHGVHSVQMCPLDQSGCEVSSRAVHITMNTSGTNVFGSYHCRGTFAVLQIAPNISPIARPPTVGKPTIQQDMLTLFDNCQVGVSGHECART